MKLWRPLVLLLACGFLAVPSVQGDTETGFTPIFDGTDLSSWEYGKDSLHRKTETPDGRFTVNGGSIVLNKADKNGKSDKKSLSTVKKFNKDFDFKFEFKAANEAQGNVTVRNLAIPVGDFKRRGEHAPLLTKFKTDDWNEVSVSVRTRGAVNGQPLNEGDKLEITYSNNKPTATLNGKPITALPLSVGIHPFLTANCNGLTFPGYGGHAVAVSGPISLNSVFGKIEFRNIRYKEVQ